MLVTYAKASGESFSGQWNPKQQNNWQTNRIYCVWLYVSKENSCIGLASKQLTPLLLLHYTQLNASAKKDQNNKHLSGASYSNHSDDTIRCTKHKIKIRIKNKNQKWVKKKINVVPWLVWWFCLTKKHGNLYSVLPNYWDGSDSYKIWPRRIQIWKKKFLLPLLVKSGTQSCSRNIKNTTPKTSQSFC